jgi:hypothetical protein
MRMSSELIRQGVLQAGNNVESNVELTVGRPDGGTDRCPRSRPSEGETGIQLNLT